MRFASMTALAAVTTVMIVAPALAETPIAAAPLRAGDSATVTARPMLAGLKPGVRIAGRTGRRSAVDDSSTLPITLLAVAATVAVEEFIVHDGHDNNDNGSPASPNGG